MSANEEKTTGSGVGSSFSAEVSPETAVAEADQQYRMSLGVEISHSGPCKKHIVVRVPRADIDFFYNDAVKGLVASAVVPGFRPGHVPRKLIEKRFRSEVGDQVKQKVLIQSLEQVADEYELDAINEPDLDVESLEIPEAGDFEFQFDVEVRPEFDLPDYNGLKLKRPSREVTDADTQRYFVRYLEQFGQMVPVDGPAQAGDFIIADLDFECNGKSLGHRKGESIRIRPVLRFQDAEIDKFDELMVGVTPDAQRDAEATISLEAEQAELRGEKVHIHFKVIDVQRLRLPELTAEFLEGLQVESEEELRSEVRKILERQVVYEQRQSARTQVLEKITESATWELPESLVRRQVENALRREVLEMQQAGFTEEQVRARTNELLQQQVSMTRQALKEHFVLDKLATEEKVEVTPADVDREITYMAVQRGESARKMRARLEKQGMMENLLAQILERKAIDIILDRAVYEDVPADTSHQDQVEALSFPISGHSAASTAQPGSKAAGSADEQEPSAES